jgi:hypothetical protein
VIGFGVPAGEELEVDGLAGHARLAESLPERVRAEIEVMLVR